MASYQFLIVYIATGNASNNSRSNLQAIYFTIDNLLNTSAIMSAFHITDQDLQKEESRFGSKNADVSAMKVRYFPPLVSYNKDYRVY